jgi:TonB family protein
LDSTPGGPPGEALPPEEERTVEKKEQEPVTASEASPATAPFIAPVPEINSSVPPVENPSRRAEASLQMGPATFGSFGRRKPVATPEKSVAPAAFPTATIAAAADPSSASTSPAPIVAPAMEAVRSFRSVRESAFALREPKPQIRGEVGGMRRWWAFGGVVVSLATISFAVGMLARRGDLRAIAEIFGRDNVTARASRGTSEDSPLNSDTTGRSSPAGKNTDEGANNSGVTPKNLRTLSHVLTLHRSRPGAFGEGTAREDSSAMLNLWEIPVSASASVAVRTRRSVPLPSETRTVDSHGGQSLQIGASTSKKGPAYPQDALDQKIEVTVRLDAWIAKDGNVREVNVLGGSPALAAAATEAVRSWRYAPTLDDGQPIETEEDVVVVFRLPH